MDNYPTYATFSAINRDPTCVVQKFNTKLNLEENKIFYPKIPQIEKYFSSETQSLKFGAVQFCGFLHDTIYVEHHVVIPAIRDISLLPVKIPDAAHVDLFKIVTDEGHHAAQALKLINSIKDEFNIFIYEEGKQIPLFIRELEKQKMQFPNLIHKAMFNMIVGVVTETRISKELGRFIHNENILSSVRENCRHHQDDETVHCSQFMALGKYTWKIFDEEQKELAASIYAKTTLARSMPDIRRISFYLSQATLMSREKCDKIINKIFTPEFLLEEVMIVVKPTIRFLEKLGVLNYKAAREVFECAGVELSN